MTINAVTPDLVTSLKALFRQIGLDQRAQDLLIAGLRNDVGDLAALTTTDKTSLVAAINSLKLAQSQLIDDTQTDTDSTWSSSKIAQAIADGIGGLVDGAPEALNTLKELAEAFQNNPDAIQNILDTLGKVVRVDVAQTFTVAEKAQARTNIGAASEADLTQLAANIGDIGALKVADYTDYVDGTRT